MGNWSLYPFTNAALGTLQWQGQGNGLKVICDSAAAGGPGGKSSFAHGNAGYRLAAAGICAAIPQLYHLDSAESGRAVTRLRSK